MIPAAIYIYEHNIRFLQRRFPSVHDKLRRLNKEEYVLGVQEDGEDYLLFYNGNVIKNSYINGIAKAKRVQEDVELLNRYYRSKEGIQKALDGIDDKKIVRHELIKRAKHLVIFGFLPAFHIEALIDLKIENIYFVEPDFGIFLLFLHLVNFENLIQKIEDYGIKVHLVVDEGGECIDFMKFLVYNIMSRGELVLGYFSYESRRMTQLRNEIQTLYEQIGLVPKKEFFSITVQNFYENIRQKNVHFFDGSRIESIEEMAVIVGSGPSLDSSLDFLKKHHKNLHIFALSSAFRPLRLSGIDVPYLFMIDPLLSFDRYNVFRGVEDELKKTTLIGSIVIDSEIVKSVKERNVAFFDYFHRIFSPPLFKKSFYVNTVLTFALNFLFEAGFRKIALIGVDLGTKHVDSFHSKLYDDDIEAVYGDMEIVEGNFGGIVFSTPDFLETKRSVEAICRYYSARCENVKLVNFSDGAKIEFFHPQKNIELLKEYFIKDRRKIENHLTKIFNRRLDDFEKRRFAFDRMAILLETMLKSIKTKNYKKFERSLQKFLEDFSNFTTIHTVYHTNFLSKVNFRLQVSQKPEILFQEIVKIVEFSSLLEETKENIILLKQFQDEI